MTAGAPLRIVHVITTLDPGGAEHHLLELCRGLPRDRFTNRVLVLKGEAALAPSFEQAGAPVTRVPLFGAADPTAAWRIAWRLGGWAPGIVHSHLFKAEVHGSLAGRMAGVPVRIATKHNEDQYLKNPAARWMGRHVAGITHRIVGISEAVRRFAIETGGLAPEQVSVIPYGIDVGSHGSDREAARAELRALCEAPPEARLVTVVGRLVPQKGHSDLLAALARVPASPPVVAAVIGAGPLESELRAQAKSLGLETRVRFTGFRSDAPALIAGSDLLVLPSRWEGFGMVLLEAMRASRPVVATRVGAIPEVVADGETGRLVAPGDPAALAEAMREVLENPAKAEAWGKTGRTRLERHFTREKMCAAWAGLYEELARERSLVSVVPLAPKP